MARRAAPPSSRRLVAFAVTATLLLWAGLATTATATTAATATRMTHAARMVTAGATVARCRSLSSNIDTRPFRPLLL